MRTLALSLLVAVVFATAVDAQVTQVPNTGCQGAVYPTHSGSARLGQPFTFGFACSLASRQAFAVMGVPGPSMTLAPPVTCLAGPCVVYPAPVGGQYGTFSWQPARGSWTIYVPNHPGLIASTWALQCACYCP